MTCINYRLNFKWSYFMVGSWYTNNNFTTKAAIIIVINILKKILISSIFNSNKFQWKEKRKEKRHLIWNVSNNENPKHNFWCPIDDWLGVVVDQTSLVDKLLIKRLARENNVRYYGKRERSKHRDLSSLSSINFTFFDFDFEDIWFKIIFIFMLEKNNNNHIIKHWHSCNAIKQTKKPKNDHKK